MMVWDGGILTTPLVIGGERVGTAGDMVPLCLSRNSLQLWSLRRPLPHPNKQATVRSSLPKARAGVSIGRRSAAGACALRAAALHATWRTRPRSAQSRIRRQKWRWWRLSRVILSIPRSILAQSAQWRPPLTPPMMCSSSYIDKRETPLTMMITSSTHNTYGGGTR